MHRVKPGEVEIAAIHYVGRSRFQYQHTEDIYIAQLAVRDEDNVVIHSTNQYTKHSTK